MIYLEERKINKGYGSGFLINELMIIKIKKSEFDSSEK